MWWAGPSDLLSRAGTVKRYLVSGVALYRNEASAFWTNTRDLTGWFCVIWVLLCQTPKMFKENWNSKGKEWFFFSPLLVFLQKNVCSRGYALSYDITAHFFRVTASRSRRFFTRIPDYMLFLAMRCAICTLVLRIVGVNSKKKSSNPGKWREVAGGGSGRG